MRGVREVGRLAPDLPVVLVRQVESVAGLPAGRLPLHGDAVIDADLIGHVRRRELAVRRYAVAELVHARDGIAQHRQP